jgi:lipoprotein-anchoring transpeptidase ErfK/SrfK
MQRQYSSYKGEHTCPIAVRSLPKKRHPVGIRQVPPPLAPAPTYLPQRPPTRKSRRSPVNALFFIVAGGLLLLAMSCAAATLGVGLVYANGILPGVQSGGAALGGMSESEASRTLQNKWEHVIVRDGQRAWKFEPTALGIMLDSDATASAAYTYGRGNPANALLAILGHIELPPVVRVDFNVAQDGLRAAESQFDQPPVNAGVRFTNGKVESTPPINGRQLDIAATIARLQYDAGGTFADGMLELAMQVVQPTVTDSTPILEQARRLLANPLDIRVFDPVTGDSVYWSVQPDQWSQWLSTVPTANSSTGFAISVNDSPVRDYLNQQESTVFDASRYLKMDEAVASVQHMIAQGQTTPYVRVYHHDGQHLVQSGETLTSIAWDTGVPYLYIEQANNGLTNVSPGQTITIPSPDTFMPYSVDPDKRIVVSISRQKTWVYENGQLKWEWATSTGIPDSPTWPGIYQIISHEPNAYAANWNLWMPNFMGVYQPIPGADFTNGFHGFPTRGSSQLLWTNSLGTRVTYGCILLSNENAQALYNWAEEGVVVEIQA